MKTDKVNKKKIKTYTINMAEIPKKGTLLIKDGYFREVITFDGVESPIIDENNKVIKPGKLLNVKRNL